MPTIDLTKWPEIAFGFILALIIVAAIIVLIRLRRGEWQLEVHLTNALNPEIYTGFRNIKACQNKVYKISDALWQQRLDERGERISKGDLTEPPSSTNIYVEVAVAISPDGNRTQLRVR